jgi:hypothetical protein
MDATHPTILFAGGDFDQTQPTRRITIFTYDPNWDFAIDFETAQFPGVGSFDPWRQLISGNKVLANTALLATLGTPAPDIAADGLARLVLRIGAATVGERFTVTLYDTVYPGPPSVAAESGTLATIDNQDSPAQQLTLTAVDTDIGPMAFAIYRAPRDFSRSGRDDNAALRAVNVVAESESGTSGTSMAIWILRPPVVLVHGLWGSRADWNTFTPLINDPLRQFFVRRADYNQDLAGRVTATVPGYTPLVMRGIRGNALGFDYAAPIVLDQIRQALVDFRQQNSAAVAQADVITHSMGGTVARTLINLQRFVAPETYGAGYIHKLITIGTPHEGSPLAFDLIQTANTCLRNGCAT